MRPQTQAEHLDDILTGLAVREAYRAKEVRCLDALLPGLDEHGHAAVRAVLAGCGVLIEALAVTSRHDEAHVTDVLRRRVLREIARDGHSNSSDTPTD